MRRLLFFILLAITASFAFQRSDFYLNGVSADWGHGCQDYIVNLSKDVVSVDTILALDATTAPGATSEVRNAVWQSMEAKNLTRKIWKPNLSCTSAEDEKTGNITETCEDKGAFEDQVELVNVWEDIGLTHSFQSKKATIVRYCADYDMVHTARGWSAEIDVVPSVDGNEYPEWEYWNVTWGNRSCTNFTNRNAAGIYSVNITTQGSYGSEIRFTSNYSGTEELIGGWAKMENESLNRYVLNVSLSNGTTQVCYYYGNTSAVGVSERANYSWACRIGDTFSGATIDANLWNVSSCSITGGTARCGGANPATLYGKIAVFTLNITRKNYVIETYARINETGGTYGFTHGYASADGSDSFRFRKAAATPVLVMENDGAEGTSNIAAWGPEWHLWSLTLNSSTGTITTDGVNATSRTSNMPNEDGYIHWTTYGTTTTNYAYLEWICVHDLTTTDGLNITYSPWVNESGSTPSGPVALDANVSSPQNASYNLSAIYVNATCTGGNASYLLNITANGSNIISSQAVTNNTLFSQSQNFSNGEWELNATCWNGSYMNTSASVFFFVNYTAPPAANSSNATINSPGNSTYSSNSTTLNVSCFGSFAAYYLNISIDGVANATDEVVLNGSSYQAVLELANGSHNVSAVCWNGTTVSDEEAVWFFISTSGIFGMMLVLSVGLAGLHIAYKMGRWLLRRQGG